MIINYVQDEHHLKELNNHQGKRHLFQLKTKQFGEELIIP